MKISAFGVVFLTCGIALAGESGLSPGLPPLDRPTNKFNLYPSNFDTPEPPN